MPSINGITAFIETHDGPLPELGHDEFSGGKSCYIPAQSGQQFWLHYIIHRPLPCKAVSIEFYVDGQRVDAQFPLSQKNIDQPTIGPVESTIKSQYGRCTDANGVEVAWRREIFFTLINPLEHLKPRCTTKKRVSESSEESQYGTIDCKVFRSEKSPEWAGAVIPDEFRSLSAATKTLKGRPISHVARFGVKMEASSVQRFCVRSLDPADAPFAWFKFHYRSRSRLMEKYKLDRLPETSLLNDNKRTPSPQKTTLSTGRLINPLGPPNAAEHDLAHWVSEAKKGADILDTMIQRLVEELALVEIGGSGGNDKITTCYEKISKLRDTSKGLRLRAVHLQKKSNQARNSRSNDISEDSPGESAGGSEEEKN